MPDRLYDMGQQVIIHPLPLFDTHTEYVGIICDYRHTRRTWVYEIEQPDGKIEKSVAQDRLLPANQGKSVNMEHDIDNQDEAIEVIAEYLERLGVEGLRQPHDPDTINKSAVIRYLITEKLDEAMHNPPKSGGMKRAGQGKKKRKSISFDTNTTKSRQ